MQSFISFLINEINGNNPIKKAVSNIKKTLENPLHKQLNKVKKSINKGMVDNKLSKYTSKEAREKMIKANASRIKKIRNTIKNNSVQV